MCAKPLFSLPVHSSRAGSAGSINAQTEQSLLRNTQTDGWQICKAGRMASQTQGTHTSFPNRQPSEQAWAEGGRESPAQLHRIRAKDKL